MNFISAAADALSRAAARMRWNAAAYGIVAICAVAAIVLLSAASVLALEPSVGPVYARLIVGAAFVLIAATVLLLSLYLSRRGGRSDTSLSAMAKAYTNVDGAGLRRRAQFSQIAMIIEAVMIGYSLSRRSDRR